MAERLEQSEEIELRRSQGRAMTYPWDDWSDGSQWAIYAYDPGVPYEMEGATMPSLISRAHMESDDPEIVKRRRYHIEEADFRVSTESMIGNIHSYARRHDMQAVTTTRTDPGWPPRIIFKLISREPKRRKPRKKA